jgi:NADH-quinone oxidoreductase subunit N
LKYFVLSALSTAFLLKGVCLLYYKTGSTNYEIIETSIRELVRGGNNEINKIELGKVLILFTLLFKLSAAPFYQWAPDLYENLETKVTKWMIVIPKLTVLSFLLLLTTDFSIYLELRSVELILLITGSLSLIVGSIALNNQWYIKRFLAYSGISHVGFKLLALYSLETQGFIFYKITYGITTINIFAILIILSEFKGRDIKKIKD